MHTLQYIESDRQTRAMMNASATRKWLSKMSPDDLCGRSWRTSDGRIVRILSRDNAIIRTTIGPMTIDHLARRIIVGSWLTA